MPKGQWHVETGILRPGRWGYALETDSGGIWQLDASRSARQYLGLHVRVEGRRAGFDLLDVHRIYHSDGRWKCSRSLLQPLFRRLGVALVPFSR